MNIHLADLAAQIEREHGFAVSAARNAVEHVVRCGRLLREAKAKLPHGQWLPWLEKHCPSVSIRTA
jgi:hypothetical protein